MHVVRLARRASVIHRADGGRTSPQNLKMLCFFHHHVMIHREGWTYRVHPDGTS